MENSAQTNETTDTTVSINQFDADAQQQTLKFKFEHQNKLFSVEHTFRSPSDEELLEYERRRNVRMREATREELGERGMAMETDAANAAIWLWDKLIVSVIGYKDSAEWKSRIPKKHKEHSITKGLLMCEADKAKLQEAEDDEVLDFDIDSSDSCEIILQCYFDKQELETKHILQNASAKQMNAYTSLMRTSYQVKGAKLGKADFRIPSKAKKLAALYDEMKINAVGYVGRVPVHHKMAVILEHLGEEQETISGN